MYITRGARGRGQRPGLTAHTTRALAEAKRRVGLHGFNSLPLLYGSASVEGEVSHPIDMRLIYKLLGLCWDPEVELDRWNVYGSGTQRRVCVLYRLYEKSVWGVLLLITPHTPTRTWFASACARAARRCCCCVMGEDVGLLILGNWLAAPLFFSTTRYVLRILVVGTQQGRGDVGETGAHVCMSANIIAGVAVWREQTHTHTERETQGGGRKQGRGCVGDAIESTRMLQSRAV